MAWKREEEKPPTPQPATPPSPPVTPSSGAPRAAAGGAILGPSISIKGEIHGQEDLSVHGKVDGKINLPKNVVTVGREGKVKADIFGSSIRVEGQVQGDLYGEKEVVINASGQVKGNITAPQVSLENGSKFKGSIDMEPGSEAQEKESSSTESKSISGPSSGSGSGGSGDSSSESKGSSSATSSSSSGSGKPRAAEAGSRAS